MAGGSPAALETTLQDWGTFVADIGSRESLGTVWEIDDLTNNGSPDVAVVAYEPIATYHPVGHLYVFDCTPDTCRILYDFPFDLYPYTKEPRILQSGDINGNGALDLTYIRLIGVNTRLVPFHRITSLEWNEDQQQLIDLTDGGIKIGGCLREIADTDGDGVSEIIANLVALERYGPYYRLDTGIYAWDGAHYVLSQTIPGPPVFRYQALEDAWAAVEEGNYEAALGLYEQAIVDDELKDYYADAPDERFYIAAYAYYRSMLVYVLSEDMGAARSVHDQLVGDFRSSGDDDKFDESKPGYGFAQIAHVFWEAFEAERNISAGCEGVVAYATEHPQPYEWLTQFGGGLDATVNEPVDLCPF